MAADGAIQRQARGLRPLDPERVAALRAELDPTADFAEDARRVLADLVTRLDGELRGGDLASCRERLAEAQARLGGLSLASLQPRGWFDSRSRRLKAFRRAFDAVRQDCATVAADLDRHDQEAGRRDGALDALWTGIRDAVATLDAHAAAAGAWLADQAAEDARLTAVRRRVEEIDALVVAAVRRLPLALGARNAALPSRDGLRQAAEELGRWSAEWARVLGVDGRKPRKVVPDPDALAGTRDALSAVLAAADRDLADAGERRAELLARLDRLETPA